MLVLDDAGVGHLAGRVVHHGHALVVGLVEHLALEAEAAVLERAQPEVVERVDGATVDGPRRDVGLLGHEVLVLHAAADLHALEHVGDHLGVATHGDALVAVVEVVVVVGETARQALDDARGQVPAVAAPLLLRVALHERLEDVATNEGERLLLEVGRLTDALSDHLLGDLGASVGWRDDTGPHLGERIHVERHVVHLSAKVGHRRVHVVIELSEAVHVVPHVPHRGVEDVGAVAMNVDALHLLGVDVAGDVVATVNDEDGLARLARGVGENGAGQAGTDNEVIVLGHVGLLGRG